MLYNKHNKRENNGVCPFSTGQVQPSHCAYAKQIELLFQFLNESYRKREMSMTLRAVLDLRSSSSAFTYAELIV